MSRRAEKMQSTRGTSNPVIDSLKAYQLEVTKSYIVSTTNRRPTLPSGELEKKTMAMTVYNEAPESKPMTCRIGPPARF